VCMCVCVCVCATKQTVVGFSYFLLKNLFYPCVCACPFLFHIATLSLCGVSCLLLLLLLLFLLLPHILYTIGFTTIRATNGYMVYATLDVSTEQLVATDLQVGAFNPIEVGLEKNLHPHFFTTRDCTTSQDCQQKSSSMITSSFSMEDDEDDDDDDDIMIDLEEDHPADVGSSGQKQRQFDHNNPDKNGNHRYLRTKNRQSISDMTNTQEEIIQTQPKQRQRRQIRQQRRQQQRRRRQREQQRRRRSLTQTTGLVRNLVIPIRFKDHAPGAIHSRPLPTLAELTTLFNHEGVHPRLCPTGSVREYFLETSFGQFDLQSTVVDWIDSPYTELEIGNGDSGYVNLYVLYLLQKELLVCVALLSHSILLDL
jgi:hypothetical protein